jgi:mannitol/fructose-specific phosphotransferase system IIA component (Ntr-type)
MPSLLNELLDPKQVALELRAANQAEAILEIVELLRANGKVEEYYKFSDAVMEREGRSSTNTGDGVAFPHARTDLVEKMVLGIGRSKKGVRFGEAKEPVHLIFLIGVPKRMVNDYLVCVGTLARLVTDKAIRAQIFEAGTAEELIEQLRSASLLLE